MDNETGFLETINDGLDPKVFTKIIDLCRTDFYSHQIGIWITKLAPGKTYAELDTQALHANTSGFLHGGVTATLADLSMRIACSTTGFVVVTANINISYFAIGEIGRKITAIGQVIRSDNNLMFAESQIKNQQGKMVAKAAGVFSTISLITDDINEFI